MRADSSGVRGAGLLVALALLSNACVALPPPPGQGRSVRYSPRGTTGPALAGAVDEEPPRVLAAQPPLLSGPEAPQRLHRRRGSQEAVTAAGPGSSDATGWQTALSTHLASRGALRELSDSTRRISREFSRLEASSSGLAGAGDGLFIRYVEYGERQLRWIDAELAAATEWAAAASEVDAPDMQLALLRMVGPRLEAAMMGALLLAVWVDVLSVTDATLSRRLYSVEMLFMSLDGWQKRLEPSMTALSSLEPEQVDAAAQDMPALVGHLTRELDALLESVRRGEDNVRKLLLLRDVVESLTLVSALKFTLPALRAAAPITLGVGLVMGPTGVMMGTRVVVSAEWVEMMRHLVRAGVLCLPAVSAAVRIQAGQVMMAQGHGDLPGGVREALGDAPEVRAMRVTGKTGAGMAEPPRHHVMPNELREWFERRGFTGKMSIDGFCVSLQQAHHQAIHGGGNWKLGRMWPGEWNRMIMEALYDAEAKAGRMLTRNTILEIVASYMELYDIPMNFVRCRGT
ncbi:DUF2380 domain-containing protein [Archangium violaceum]|uniref:DUF2380 domain-containing protein n=1 Tax=Archangium violaceum TaxID=83451 RepID=UPI0036DD7411